jgi:hypothetical protein
VGAAAVDAWLRRAGRPAAASRPDRLLAFDEPGGPLVAVCGLVPGAGASTLAYALAHRAAIDSSAQVLLCEANPSAGGLAALTGAESEHSFAQLALRASAGSPPARPFATLPGGLRLIATPPRRCALPGVAGLALLREARAAHGLTVVDCGALAGLECLPALQLATHTLWVVPATPLALRRARAALAALAPRPNGAAEALVAIDVVGRGGAPGRELRELAAARADRVVLVRHARALVETPDASPARELEATLADLTTLLRRRGS